MITIQNTFTPIQKKTIRITDGFSRYSESSIYSKSSITSELASVLTLPSEI